MNLLKPTALVLLVFSLSANAEDQQERVRFKLRKVAHAFDAMPAHVRTKYANLKDKAYKARENEKYFTSIVAITDAQALFKGDLDLFFLNGNCFAQLHDVDKAISHYEKVLAVDPFHIFTLINIIEINYFAGRYEETIKYISRLNAIIERPQIQQQMPLLDFKHLIALSKLSEKKPDQYQLEVNKLRSKYTYMDDNPFFYYAHALKLFEAGEKHEGLKWIYKAYHIFNTPAMIETWNKALVDTGYIGAYQLIFSEQ